MTRYHELTNGEYAKGFYGTMIACSDFVISLHTPGNDEDGTRLWQWPVHLRKLAEASTFFKAILDGKDWKEHKESRVELHEDEPDIISRALQFIYFGSYCDDWHDEEWATYPESYVKLQEVMQAASSFNDEDQPLQLHDRLGYATKDDVLQHPHTQPALYSFAEKYGIPSLKAHVVRYVMNDFESYCLFSVEDFLYIAGAFPSRREDLDDDLWRGFASIIAGFLEYNRNSPVDDVQKIEEMLLADSWLTLIVIEHIQTEKITAQIEVRKHISTGRLKQAQCNTIYQTFQHEKQSLEWKQERLREQVTQLEEQLKGRDEEPQWLKEVKELAVKLTLRTNDLQSEVDALKQQNELLHHDLLQTSNEMTDLDIDNINKRRRVEELEDECAKKQRILDNVTGELNDWK